MSDCAAQRVAANSVSMRSTQGGLMSAASSACCWLSAHAGYAMAVIMGLAAVVGLRGLERGVKEAAETATTGVADQPPDESPRRRGRQGRGAGPRRAWS
jgi:hypothetical protein